MRTIKEYDLHASRLEAELSCFSLNIEASLNTVRVENCFVLLFLFFYQYRFISFVCFPLFCFVFIRTRWACSL